MKIYVVENQRTKEIVKFAENNKKGMALLFYSALPNWETKGSRCWKEYCKKYTDVKEYDKHLDTLEIKERKEFFSDLLNNNNKYNVLYKIISILDKVCENIQEERVC